jgi:hypothetical protein
MAMEHPLRSVLLTAALAAFSAAASGGLATVVPTLTTTAGATGGAVSDTAHLSGGLLPSGTITFRLYGPNDATCGNPPIDSEVVPVSGNGDYASDGVVVPAVGTYRFTAEYSGDASNTGVNPVCNAPNESVDIVAVAPTLTTTATPSGSAIGDIAHLTGGNHPTGTIQFLLFGPNDATCGGLAIAPEPLLVGGNGDYPSGDITPVLQGTYRWTASYSGDVANNPVATKCNDANETSIVTLTPTAQIPALGHGGLALFAALLGGAGWLLARK